MQRRNPTAPLAFGTSGLRGLVSDITDLEAYVNVKGALRYLLRTGDLGGAGAAEADGAKRSVVLAGDLRPSTARIMRACGQAIRDLGFAVENAGAVPSPALIARAMATGRAGVMVTGSHIPFDRNGIKLSKPGGEVLKSDEPGITAEVALVRAEEEARFARPVGLDERPAGPDERPGAPIFDAAGMLTREAALPPVDPAAEEGYLRRYLGVTWPGVGLRGLRVLLYQHSAVGRDLLPRILSGLGAEVVAAGRSESFIPIDTENITAEQLDRLELLVKDAERAGGPIHAIVSTDGDSDRPLVTAVVGAAEAEGGRRVRFLPGDLLGIVTAEYLAADAAVVPISASEAVAARMGERGVLLRRSRIGSPYVIALMDELRQAHRRVVGWEANGGFLTGSDIALPGGTLAALPTRDATLPILANLLAAAEQGIGLSVLWGRLPARFGRAGLIDDVPVVVGQAILAGLTPPGGVTEVAFAGGEVLDRSLPGAPTPLEGAAAVAWRASREILTGLFLPALGFADLVRINVLDGVRVTFADGDVAHIRPSGNAPQLRLYADSGSQARSDQIIALGLREPDGLLRRLIGRYS